MVSDNVVAVLIAIVANSIYNIGLIFKRKGACTLPDIDEQSAWQNIKNFAQCKTWFFGFSLTIIQWFPLMYAIKIGSLSLIAPTMGIGFIVLLLLSWLYLKEPIKPIEIVGIFIVIGAITMLYVIAPIESGNYDLEQMNVFFREASAIGFLCAFIAIVATLRLVTRKRKFPQVGAMLAVSSGLSYALATIFAKGAIGSLTFANISDFLKNSLSAWQWWIYLFMMCVGYFIAFTSQQMALQKGKALVVSPTIDISRVFMQIMAGIFVFNEWHDIWHTLLLWQKVLKVLAIFFIIFGISLLSFFKAIKEEHEDEILHKSKEEHEDEISSQKSKDEALAVYNFEAMETEEISEEKSISDQENVMHES